MSSNPAHDTFQLEGLWPNEMQNRILRAGLCEKEEAIQAMKAWLSEHDSTQHVDEASMRLVPLAYTNLTRHGFEDPIMGRFSKIAMLNRIKSMQVFKETEPVLSALSEQAIPTLVLKGLHLSKSYYQDIAARPMSDADIAVPRAFAHQAHQLLTDLGYSRDYPDKPFEDILRLHHASSYSKEGCVDIDLHWRIMPLKDDPEVDKPFWETARPQFFGQAEALVLSPTCLFYHTVIHGVRWNPLPPLRWIADAISQLRSDRENIDWNALEKLARDHKTTHRLGRGMRYLREVFSVDLPNDLIERLEKTPLSMVEKIENRLVVYNDRDESDLKAKYMRLFGEYYRASYGKNPLRFATEYLDYLIVRTTGISTRWQMIGFLTSGLLKRGVS